MNREYSGVTAIVVGAILILFGLAACQPTPDNTNDAESAPARENPESGSPDPADDVAAANGTAAIEPERAVVAETLPYAEVNDELFYGHFVFPSDMVEPLPALIVIHEWRGLTDGVRALADRLAAEGYIVLAVDLFGGRTADYAADARELMQDVLEHPENANKNIRQAYAFVRDTAGAPRVGSLGRDFGGTWALNTALLFPDDLDAAVIYYGRTTADMEKLKPLQVPILGLFAENDSTITAASVQNFRQTLDDLGITHEIEIYPNTEHAFANPDSEHYNAEAAKQAWDRALAFLDDHLSPGTVD